MPEPLIELGPQLFLVCLGHAMPGDILEPERRCYPGRGLLFTQTIANGESIELFIAAPSDLLAFAGMHAVTIRKPVCLPLDLAQITPHGRINARLRTDAQAHRLATLMLEALASLSDPASAGV